jgi:hypothetical protein
MAKKSLPSAQQDESDADCFLQLQGCCAPECATQNYIVN